MPEETPLQTHSVILHTHFIIHFNRHYPILLKPHQYATALDFKIVMETNNIAEIDYF